VQVLTLYRTGIWKTNHRQTTQKISAQTGEPEEALARTAPEEGCGDLATFHTVRSGDRKTLSTQVAESGEVRLLRPLFGAILGFMWLKCLSVTDLWRIRVPLQAVAAWVRFLDWCGMGLGRHQGRRHLLIPVAPQGQHSCDIWQPVLASTCIQYLHRHLG
jgi:hypothetical protein